LVLPRNVACRGLAGSGNAFRMEASSILETPAIPASVFAAVLTEAD
jgi:hypothetical protein